MKKSFLLLVLFLLEIPFNARANILKGDVNGDGKVNIADITILIDYLLLVDDSEIVIENSDVYTDGLININDLTVLVDIVLDNQSCMPFTPANNSFTILHLSDSHGYSVGLKQAMNELSDSTIDVLLFTGDWTRHAIEGRTAITTKEIDTAFCSIKMAYGSKLFMLAGNHDVYDNITVGKSQSGATSAIKEWMAYSSVNWGDTTGVASYWHKDYTLSSSSILRIIALDQYETTNVGMPLGDWNYQPIYSQAQIDWLIEKLKELSADDYLIIALHEPAYNDSKDGVNTVEATSIASDNLWCSSDFSKFNYKGDESSRNLLPKIMKNYLNKETESWTHKNLDKAETTISVNADFNGNIPGHFLFYIGGHRHCDFIHELPLVDENGIPTGFDKQMMIHIAAADWTVQSSTDDDLLIKYKDPSRYENTGYRKADESDPDYRLNKIVINFLDGKVAIERIGATHTHHNTMRDEYEFNFTN